MTVTQARRSCPLAACRLLANYTLIALLLRISHAARQRVPSTHLLHTVPSPLPPPSSSPAWATNHGVSARPASR